MKKLIFLPTVVILLLLTFSSHESSANKFKYLWKKSAEKEKKTDEKLSPKDWPASGEYHRSLFTQREQDVENATEGEVAAMNEAEIWRMERIAREPVNNPNGRAEFVSKDQADQILSHVKQHPVVGFSTGNKYDPEGGIGFCFGRSMYTHLLLLHLGVDNDSIMKIWAIGPMNSGSTDWRYHVSTLVKAAEGGWWVIDRYTGSVMTIEEWMEYMKRTSTDDKLKFYFTSPKRFGPSSPSKYDPYQLALRGNGSEDFYNSYFKDMMEYFKSGKHELEIEKFEEEFNFRHEDKFEPKPLPFKWKPIPLNFFGKPSCSALFWDLSL